MVIYTCQVGIITAAIMKTLSLKLSDGLDSRLASAVARRGIRKSDLVREAIEKYLATDRPEQPGSFLDAMKDFVGSLEGPADLSTNPKHLEDFGRDSRGDRRHRPPRRIAGKK
jgi:hypothetical protein